MNGKVLMVLVVLFLLLVGVRLFLFFQRGVSYQEGQLVRLTTTLLSEPKREGLHQRFSVSDAHGTRLFVRVPSFPRYSYGDTIVISGTVHKTVPNRENTAASTVNSWVLLKENVVLSVSYPMITTQEKGSGLLAPLVGFRQHITRFFQAHLSSSGASLLLGIVFGIKDSMPKAFSEQLQIVGLLHVVAASGMNVTILGGVLVGIGTLFFSRFWALLLTIGGIVFYTALASFEPSIVRAAVMGSLVFGSQLFGRQAISLYILFLTGCMMLLSNPLLLLDIGFQLSFLATAGLILLTPFVPSRVVLTVLPKQLDGVWASLWESFTTTSIAQLATTPLLLWHFGSYSLVSIVANVLILWTIPLLMLLGALAVLLSFVSDTLAGIVLFLATPVLFYFEGVVSFFAQHAWMLSFETFPTSMMVGSYVILLACFFYLRERGTK